MRRGWSAAQPSPGVCVGVVALWPSRAALLCATSPADGTTPGLHALDVEARTKGRRTSPSRALQVICYRGDPDARKAIWRRQMRGGRGGQAGPGTHVVLTTYDFLMSGADRRASAWQGGQQPQSRVAACAGGGEREEECKGGLRVGDFRKMGLPLPHAWLLTFRREACRPRLSRVHWGYICVDEGHRLKNAGCKLNAELRAYRTDHRLLLTGLGAAGRPVWLRQSRPSKYWLLLRLTAVVVSSLKTRGQKACGPSTGRHAAAEQRWGAVEPAQLPDALAV